jgi:hypothetical protein
MEGFEMAIYKVVLDGSFQGQKINNILYYRNGAGLDIGGLTLGGAKEVADAVKAIVWPALKVVLPDTYILNQINSYVYNDQTFDLLYQVPFTLGVQETGLENGHSYNGPAVCAIMKFILEPHIVLANGVKPPVRGYLAIGPISDTRVNNDGSLSLVEPQNLQWDAICAVMANNVYTVLPIPAAFFPIRVHQDKVGIVEKLKITSFSDVQACVMRHQTSFRRSRMPEN